MRHKDRGLERQGGSNRSNDLTLGAAKSFRTRKVQKPGPKRREGVQISGTRADSQKICGSGLALNRAERKKRVVEGEGKGVIS